jgi:transcriptional regulator with XRE-family HTH domain
MKALPQQLKELRAREKLTQEEFAKKIGSTRANVSSWEIGRAEPDVETLKRIASIFCVSLDDLLDLDSIVNPNIDLSPLEHFKDYFESLTPEKQSDIAKELVNMILEDKKKKK